MKYEIRVRDYEKLSDIIDLEFDIVGIGDEGCVHKLPNIEIAKDMIKKIKNARKMIRIITPKIPERHLRRVVELIKIISNETEEFWITINDLGLLYALKKEKIELKHVTIGRAISRSFEDCLWYEHILRDEDEFVKDAIIQNNMAHKVKIDFFKDYQIDAIESNMLEHQEKAFANLKNCGYKVCVHYGYIAVAFSRACQTAKYYKAEIPDCKAKCSKPIHMTMTGIWDRKEYLKPSSKVEEINPTYNLIGCVLYRDYLGELSAVKFTNIDVMILNYSQFENVLKLEQAIRKIREVA